MLKGARPTLLGGATKLATALRPLIFIVGGNVMKPNVVSLKEWEFILKVAEESHQACFEQVKKLDDTPYQTKWDQLEDLKGLAVYVDEFEYTAKLLAQTTTDLFYRKL